MPFLQKYCGPTSSYKFQPWNYCHDATTSSTHGCLRYRRGPQVRRSQEFIDFSTFKEISTALSSRDLLIPRLRVRAPGGLQLLLGTSDQDPRTFRCSPRELRSPTVHDRGDLPKKRANLPDRSYGQGQGRIRTRSRSIDGDRNQGLSDNGGTRTATSNSSSETQVGVPKRLRHNVPQRDSTGGM